MEIKLNDYHKKVNAEMRAKVAYWQEHPQSRKESLRRLKLLREQRLANLSNGGLETYNSLSPRANS